MKKFKLYLTLFMAIFFSFSCSQKSETEGKLLLKDNWAIQSSAKITADGSTISSLAYNPDGWYPTSMPSTVLAALYANGQFPDPYYGTNFEKLPGYYKGFNVGMPENSPFRVPWWYRTVFNIPAEYQGKNMWLNFHSINYKANIWLNGKLVADTSEIEGAYRLFDLDITRYAEPGKDNCLALEIFPPKGMDLTITWVDWNPTAPDRAMGIWYDVFIKSTGSVAIKNPRVITDLDLPATDKANITISAEVVNTGETEVSVTLKGTIEDKGNANIDFAQGINLRPGENRLVTFSPDDYSQLRISNPRLWWPHTVGSPELYNLTLELLIDDKVSDIKNVRFGIREITSWMNKFDGKLTRVFQVNGKNIVIRGGGYVQDLMLRQDNARVYTDIMYAKHMGLNALRMEAPRGSDYLFDLCDEQGIMLMVGWCCCSSWERWRRWTPDIADIAEKSWRDQIVHLRNHPSVFDWLYGSDNPPPAEYEKRYIDVLNTYDGTRPYQSSATADSSDIAGYTGLYMGPWPEVYSYLPPSFWYTKLEFNTEAGPGGEQIPPMETMRKMMPEEDLWPISKSWELRLHESFGPDARKALFSRYGEPESVEEYSMKSQVLQMEAVRAMFEAYAGNKYRSSGIIYWMYNSAWPSLYWQFYDYFFAPNGAFYAARKANEPLHIQYSYGDSCVYIVNNLYQNFEALIASAHLYDFSLQEKYSNEVQAIVSADKSLKIMDISWPDDSLGIYFLDLRLTDAEGKLVSSNFYWLSAKGDEHADFKKLNSLPEVNLNVSVSPLIKKGGTYSLDVTVENPSSSLAFAINPKLLKGNSKDLVLPVFWEDNYFSLLPRERRTVKVKFNVENLDGEKPMLDVEGWNIKFQEITLH
jgi:exo-1,4-beta-D-glucosaminidase